MTLAHIAWLASDATARTEALVPALPSADLAIARRRPAAPERNDIAAVCLGQIRHRRSALADTRKMLISELAQVIQTSAFVM
ncbi:hypothetical protein ASL20_11290 [Cupriavidus necator]|nr:hypothetical protein ASL20_11290 [Cupriavidus necator]